MIAIFTLVFFNALSFFPIELFLTLIILILIVNELQQSGFTDQVGSYVEIFLHGKSKWKQYLGLSLLGTLVSSVGLGNIVGISLLAPLTQKLIHKLNLRHSNAFLFLILGVNAGALSPVTPTAAVVQTLLLPTEIHLEPWLCYLFNALGHYGVVIALLVGIKLFEKNKETPCRDQEPSVGKECTHGLPYPALLALLLIALLPLLTNLSLLTSCAIGLAIHLTLKQSSQVDWKSVPWDIIWLVCAMSGISLWLYHLNVFQEIGLWLSNHASGWMLINSLALLAALSSIVASSSAVVLPVFLLLLVSLHGSSQIYIVGSMYLVIFCAHIVDVSPFSTLGALALATEQDTEKQSALRKQLLLSSILLAVVSAILGSGLLWLVPMS